MSTVEFLGVINEELSWQEGAPCAQTDPEVFFPETTGDALQARRICAGCDVRDQCLQYAMDNREVYGIWGGMSRDERRMIRKGIPVDFWGKLGTKWLAKHDPRKRQA